MNSMRRLRPLLAAGVPIVVTAVAVGDGPTLYTGGTSLRHGGNGGG